MHCSQLNHVCSLFVQKIVSQGLSVIDEVNILANNKSAYETVNEMKQSYEHLINSIYITTR